MIYVLFVGIALILNIIVLLFLHRKYGFRFNEIIGFIIYENMGIILGGKLLSFLLFYDKYNGQLNFLTVGFVAYGAALGAFLFMVLFSIQFGKSLKNNMLMCSSTFPLMYGLGKIGCHFAGCCHGFEYSGFLKVVYEGVSYFPIQLIEAIVFIFIFLIMFILQMKNKLDDNTFFKFFCISCVSKSLLDFLRMDKFKFLSFNQIFSIIFLIIAFTVKIILDKKKIN